MKQEEIFKKIGTILNELHEQYEFIEKTKDDINDLELELFAANTHYLIENIEVLRKHNKHKPEAQTTVESPPVAEKFFEPVVQPAQTSRSSKKEPVAKADDAMTEDIKPEEPIIRHELKLDDIEPMAYDEEDIAFLEDEPEVEPEKPAEVSPKPVEKVIEKPVEVLPVEHHVTAIKPAATVNQVIAGQLQQTRLADQFDLPAISDLKSAINLNDKLLYVKDLFNGYSMAYGEAVDILNHFNKFEEADNFLKANYTKKNNWEARQATADKFYALLRRRYPA